CRAEQVGEHAYGPSAAGDSRLNATCVPLAGGGAVARRATARLMAINSAAGGNWAKRGVRNRPRVVSSVPDCCPRVVASIAGAIRQFLPKPGGLCGLVMDVSLAYASG